MNTDELKVGDQVVCVHGNGAGQVVTGKIYEVREVHEYNLVGLNVWPWMLFNGLRFRKIN